MRFVQYANEILRTFYVTKFKKEQRLLKASGTNKKVEIFIASLFESYISEWSTSSLPTIELIHLFEIDVIPR